MKRLRVLVLLDPDLMPPDSREGYSEQEINVWKTEYDVVSTLRAIGHDVRPLGVQHELKPIRDEIEKWKPDVVFNLLEDGSDMRVSRRRKRSKIQPVICYVPSSTIAHAIFTLQIFIANFVQIS